jgi:hypothetical protein
VFLSFFLLQRLFFFDLQKKKQDPLQRYKKNSSIHFTLLQKTTDQKENKKIIQK